jgi:hypothetical protein
MIFISTNWELHYPSINSFYLSHIFSDHAPLILDTGIVDFIRPFHFIKKSWLYIEGFDQLVTDY